MNRQTSDSNVVLQIFKRNVCKFLEKSKKLYKNTQDKNIPYLINTITEMQPSPTH
jgi:hypothetical protein